MVRLALVAALVLVGCAGDRPAADVVVPAVQAESAPPAMAREQLFFSGSDEDGPVLAVLVLQREPRASGAVVEVKGFVAVGGLLRSPFYERTELPAWPGDGVPEALRAWRSARTGDPVRIRWQDDGDALDASFRTTAASVQLTFETLGPAGDGVGPHGLLQWRAGRATLSLDGKEVAGVGATESLRGDVANPTFGSFELWVLAPTPGSLVLGRRTLGAAEPGGSLRVNSQGRAEHGAFDVEVTDRLPHEPTGFALPIAWRLPSDGGASFDRVGPGRTVTGVAPSGGPAVYDVGFARSEDGGSAALVFHLQDGAPGGDR